MWSVGLMGVFSVWGQWVWSLGVVSGWWIYFLPHNDPTPIVSVLFGSFIPTFYSIYIVFHSCGNIYHPKV